jgi:hypothetical protein
MRHLHDQVASQAHGWFTVDELWLNALSHDSTLHKVSLDLAISLPKDSEVELQ